MNTKEQVLSLLSARQGCYYSGEQLAASLGCSRNAVWKAITSLRADGWKIEAVTNKGYCLAPDNDILSAEEILRCLPAEIRQRIPEILVYPSVLSTNQTAKMLAVSGAAQGTCVIAASQTAGRGRHARAFFSPEGGLYLSIILRPDALFARRITAVTAFAANAVCDAVETFSGRSPQIKWVNDIFLGDRKICGILTEAVTDIESGSPEWIVVGIGINVTTPPEAFPENLRETAASVFPADAPPAARCRLAAEIIGNLLHEPKPTESALYEAYRSRLMLGREVTVADGDRQYRVMTEDIDTEGHLLVRMTDGSLRALSAEEIRILP